MERNFFREWVEELYAADTHERADFMPPPDPDDEPEVLRLRQLVDNGTARLQYTGISVNLMTLRPEICLLLVIDDPRWYRNEREISKQMDVRPIALGWEYAQGPQEIEHRSLDQPDHWLLRLDANLRPINELRPKRSFLVPNAAAAIKLGLDVARAQLR